MSSDDDELLREFLVESRDNLNQLDRDFVALEQNPREPKLLGAIFRCVHTIKGTAGFLGLVKLEALTHIGESQLSRLRDGALELDTQLASALLAMVDAIRRTLSVLEATGSEGEEDFTSIVRELSSVGAVAVTAPKPASVVPAAVVAPAPPPVAKVAPAPVATPPAAPAGAVAPTTVALPPVTPPFAEGSPEGKTGGGVADTAIRVDVGLLDRVMNLVGELVLARNQTMQYGAVSKDAGFVNASQRLNLLTTELQAGVMKTRMQPIGNVWNRFPRIVRDLANVCGKKVTVDLDGTETELDRSIIEAIKDPLTHAVRNAVDHGIESPEARRAAGKPAVGRLLLRAYHEGGQVNIEVTDDGGGLAVDKIRARAVERGLITAERAARMSDREVAHLIFLPGFSTADQVTNVSGRGVGMDVVKTNIEKIGGTVDISSRPGLGSTLKIKIPLTLAIIPALIVTSGGERFAIPQVNLLELVRLEGAQARRGIERLHGTNVYRLRGNLLPLVFLNRALGLQSLEMGDDVCNIVVLQADDRQFGLVVDGISDTEEIVVKPLGKELKGISSFAGATIMGDGRVALILDVLGIAQRQNVVSPSRDRAIVDKAPEPQAAQDAREALLLFRVGSAARMAIPLSMVARLEEIAPEKVERAAGRDVVQYRGAILPLLMLGRELLREPRPESTAPLLVIVYSEKGRSIGLVVEQILDVVEEVITVRSQASRDGVLGSAVVQNRVTDLLDVHGVIRRFDASFFDRKDAA
jgi:two-component system, chemotaxis family, sensor kinase CheA